MQYFLYFCARIWKKISKQVKRINFYWDEYDGIS